MIRTKREYFESFFNLLGGKLRIYGNLGDKIAMR